VDFGDHRGTRVIRETPETKVTLEPLDPPQAHQADLDLTDLRGLVDQEGRGRGEARTNRVVQSIRADERRIRDRVGVYHFRLGCGLRGEDQQHRDELNILEHRVVCSDMSVEESRSSHSQAGGESEDPMFIWKKSLNTRQ